MSDVEEASLCGKLGSGNTLNDGGNIGNSGRDAHPSADQAGDHADLLCFSSDDASGEAFPVSMATDTGGGVDRSEILPDYGSDVTGVFNGDDVNGEASPVAESGSDVTGVFSSDDASGGGSPVDECGSDVTGVFSSDDASGDEFPVDESRGDACNGDAGVRGQDKRGTFDEYRSGVDGDRNLGDVARCGAYQYLKQAWRRKQRGAAQSEITQVHVQSREHIGTGDGVSCWGGGRLQMDCEQMGAVRSEICPRRVQTQSLTGTGIDILLDYDVTGVFSSDDGSEEECPLDESESDVTGVFSSDDGSRGASPVDQCGGE